MAEELCKVGDVELCYETFGERGGAPLLLVMGLGTQMIAWREEFCAMLVDRGFFVIRFDNRDIGRSTHLDGVRPPTLRQMITRDGSTAAYTLDDMADDAAGLLDCLGIDAAHVVGASMGGMIGQIMAGRHPEKVLTLTSIMSNTGKRWHTQPGLKVIPFFLAKRPRTKEEAAERTVKLLGVVGSTKFERDDDDVRRLAETSFERGGGDGSGTGRQMAAVFAAGDRTETVRAIKAPTLVIHGTVDKLAPPRGGKATAKAIPGARLELIDGMGHDMPRGVWPRLVDLIAEHAARVPRGERATA
jgi:pimeloyl-ACP methyl ester carboxylesterase